MVNNLQLIEFLLLLIELSSAVILLYFIERHRQDTHIRALFWLEIFLVVLLFTSMNLLLISSIPNIIPEDYYLSSIFLMEVHLIELIIGGGIFIQFLKEFTKEEYLDLSQTIFNLLGLPYILYFISQLINPNQTSTVLELMKFSGIICVLFVYTISTITLYSIKKRTNNSEMDKVATRLMFSLIFYFLIIFPIQILFDFWIPQLTSTTIPLNFSFLIANISLICGNLIMISIFYSTNIPFYNFRIANKLLILNNAGNPVFTYNFGTNGNENRITDTLFSGGLTAVRQIFDEAYGLRELETIKFRQFQFLVSIYNNFSIFFMVDESTNYFQRSLEKFGKLVNRYFSTKLKENPTYALDHEITLSLIQEAFGFTTFVPQIDLSEI